MAIVTLCKDTVCNAGEYGECLSLIEKICYVCIYYRSVEDVFVLL